MDSGIIFTCDDTLNAALGFSATVTVILSSASWEHSSALTPAHTFPSSSHWKSPFLSPLAIHLPLPSDSKVFHLGAQFWVGVYVNNHNSIQLGFCSVPPLACASLGYCHFHSARSHITQNGRTNTCFDLTFICIL